MAIIFVKVIREEGMKRGFALDKAGKFWQGFSSNRTEEEVSRSAYLGSVGICCVCGNRVYEGWGCISEPIGKRDACDCCVVMPKKVAVVKCSNEKEWEKLCKELKR